jgi:hypothetical protein
VNLPDDDEDFWWTLDPFWSILVRRFGGGKVEHEKTMRISKHGARTRLHGHFSASIDLDLFGS